MFRLFINKKSVTVVLVVAMVLISASFTTALIVSSSFRETVVEKVRILPQAIIILPEGEVIETNATPANLTEEQIREIEEIQREQIEKIYGSDTLWIGHGEVTITEGVDESINSLPDDQYIYYAVVQRYPVNIYKILEDLDSLGARYVKSFGMRGYYAHSTVENAKKVAELEYVRSVFIVPGEVKMREVVIERMQNNLSVIRRMVISVLENPSEDYKKIIESEGNVRGYSETTQSYFMDINGSGVLELSELDIVEGIELSFIPSINPPQVKIKNESQS